MKCVEKLDDVIELARWRRPQRPQDNTTDARIARLCKTPRCEPRPTATLLNFIQKNLSRPFSVAVHERKQTRMCDDLCVGLRVAIETLQRGVECRAKFEESLRHSEARQVVVHQQLSHTLGYLDLDCGDLSFEVYAPPVAVRHPSRLPVMGRVGKGFAGYQVSVPRRR
jgi:hypothetical protein